MLEYTRFLNAPEIPLDWNHFLVDPALDHIPSLLNDIGPQNPTPQSIDISSRVPDESQGDDDFHELKPVRCPWLVSESQRIQLQETLSHFEQFLPSFEFPSRLAIARYMSGYVDGFSHHNPFIHIPTLRNMANEHTPELTLAILAIGAQYRYEKKTARSLYQATRAVVLERWRQGTFFCPSRQLSSFGPHSVPKLSNHEWMHRIRTLLLLTIFASWQSDSTLIQEAFEYQSILARCIREIGLSEFSDDAEDDWLAWARNESDRRTKLLAWSLLSLHGFAFDTPPSLLGRELNMFLPSSCKEWVAQNRTQWLEAHQTTRTMFKEAHRSHLATGESQLPVADLSPVGNYILIHALIQRIYLTQQLSPDVHAQRLRPQDISDFEHALNRWRHTWRTSPESGLDLHDPYNSLSFTSTALLGAAHVRLHCNLGQWRDLQSCDPSIIAATLKEAPPPQRGHELIYALLHAVHALNIPAQIGISYLAHCKSFSWSMQHALCDLECGAFLSKWLLSISASCDYQPLSGKLVNFSTSRYSKFVSSTDTLSTALEDRVVRWIGRVVREALLSHDDTVDLLSDLGEIDLSNPRQTTRKLSYAVVKVWAHLFKLCNSPWPIVNLIGQSLDQYAELVQPELISSQPYSAS
ncbi:unnamed protein product [Penicillium olsonii]|nr:unnamed protein product [Penicillium olsonii]CAG7930690.1 unnamed protein product [Penicillium olsonii]